MEGMERKLAVLLAKVSGSARLYERLGDAEAVRAVDRCIKRMERAVEGFRGRLVKSVGHELVATFDSTEDAFQGAVEMQRRVADLPPVSGVKLGVRIGFHRGPMAVTGDEILGDEFKTAARVVGIATPGQILTTSTTLTELPAISLGSLRDRGQLSDTAGGVGVYEVSWQRVEEPERGANVTASPPVVEEKKSIGKLSVHYRNRIYAVDAHAPIMSLGRDPGCDIVIADRKASRHHARIELRGENFFFVDRSTNGSYVALSGAQEVMLRRAEMVLEGSGSVCFGGSINDPAAECVTFERL